MRSLYFKSIFCALVILCAQFSFIQHAGAQDAAQQKIDEQKLQEYFTKNNIHPLKGPGGLYYTIAKEGTGPKILAGSSVTINYTGKLLDGKVFDSNTDPAFRHMQPFTVEIGVGRVIQGWDKGVQLLKKGSVATLYIPSGMGYGPGGSGGSIPPNSVLIFDVEVISFSK